MSIRRQVEFSRVAQKALRSIDRKAARLIVAKVEQYAADPASLANNVVAMRGSDNFRLRVGDYRVIFTETLVVVLVLKVGHRREIYEQGASR